MGSTNALGERLDDPETLENTGVSLSTLFPAHRLGPHQQRLLDSLPLGGSLSIRDVALIFDKTPDAAQEASARGVADKLVQKGLVVAFKASGERRYRLSLQGQHATHQWIRQEDGSKVLVRRPSTPRRRGGKR